MKPTVPERAGIHSASAWLQIQDGEKEGGEYIPVTRKPRTRLALISPHRRRMRKGMIGLWMRASRARNPAMSATARPPKPRTWDEIQPWLVASIEPKSTAGRRRVPIAAVLRDYLAAHRMTRQDGLAFGRTDGTPFATSTISLGARTAWKRAGLRPITLHECRHTFASLMIAAGVNPKVQRRGRDSNPRWTEPPIPVFETATGGCPAHAVCRDSSNTTSAVGKSVGKSGWIGAQPRCRESVRRSLRLRCDVALSFCCWVAVRPRGRRDMALSTRSAGWQPGVPWSCRS